MAKKTHKVINNMVDFLLDTGGRFSGTKEECEKFINENPNHGYKIIPLSDIEIDTETE